MPYLEVCSLSGNSISTLEDFSHCSNLQELYIRKNNVQNLEDIHWLKKLNRLRVLWLSDNVCASKENYRLTVLRTLPNLQKLDNTAVTEEEINRALEEGEELSFPDNYKTDDIPPLEALSVEQTEICVSVEQTEICVEDVAQVTRIEIQHNDTNSNPVSLSWEETNNIRRELGLKPLPFEKISTTKSVTTGVTKARHANILQATLLLIKELDKDSLEIVENEIKSRLEFL